MKLKYLCASIIFCSFGVASAAPLMVNSQTLVNFNQTLSSIKAVSSAPFQFPAQIPQDARKAATLYANYDPMATKANAYTFYVDSTATCQGAHYCNIGSLQVTKNGKPEQSEDMSHHLITQTIKTPGNPTVYYTPGHAMGDYWSPNIQWVSNGYLYSLTWDLANSDAQSVLTQMVQGMRGF